ncbi:MAG: hypothetical protein ACI4IS_02920 [Acutalibacteraceae bacterium]
MITINTKDGNTAEWKDGEYTDYCYDGKCFIVIKNYKQVAFYNVDCMRSIVVI